ncbi:hypothetical protein SBRY_40658 [Actinacidiphila bryophytorum]|uniref:Uncharacterized protein n=1 Tax=Actinacidiphila bryophytorum TaxID=1436133 RepID=A0A9W4H3C4_9ACTN|nr:hypothetical protein SBRY_40658 [Actinacidiphila bryophytorum]
MTPSSAPSLHPKGSTHAFPHPARPADRAGRGGLRRTRRLHTAPRLRRAAPGRRPGRRRRPAAGPGRHDRAGADRHDRAAAAAGGRRAADAGANTAADLAGRAGDRAVAGLLGRHGRPLPADRGRRLAAGRRLARAQCQGRLDRRPPRRRPALPDRGVHPLRRGRPARRPGQQAALPPLARIPRRRARLPR